MEPESSSTDTSGKVARGVLLTGGLAAVLASTCCLGPLVLISLGVSGAWIGNLTTLEPYRPALIVAAVVALAVVWWRVWRPVAACESGLICAFLDVNHSDKTLFWIVLALVVVAIGFPLVAPWFYSRDISMKNVGLLATLVALAPPLLAATQTVALSVPDMNCAACPITVKMALRKVSGVSKTDVDLDRREAKVTFDDGKTTVDALTRATKDAGYHSTLVRVVK